MFRYCCEDATIVAPGQPSITDPYGWIRSRALVARDARALQPHIVPPKTEGAGKAGCALHPRSRVQDVHKNTHTSIYQRASASSNQMNSKFRGARLLFLSCPGIAKGGGGFFSPLVDRHRQVFPGCALPDATSRQVSHEGPNNTGSQRGLSPLAGFGRYSGDRRWHFKSCLGICSWRNRCLPVSLRREAGAEGFDIPLL
jgi:hypothetical protein